MMLRKFQMFKKAEEWKLLVKMKKKKIAKMTTFFFLLANMQ